MAEGPSVQRLGDDYYVGWIAYDLVIRFARIDEHRDTLSAEITVTVNSIGVLHWARLNLVSTQARSTLAKALDATCAGVPWSAVLERACRLLAVELRTPEVSSELYAEPPDPGRFLVDDWIPLRDTTVLFGDGGVGKSLLALAVAVAGLQGHPIGPWSVAGLGRVLYLDWEGDAATQRRRLWQLTQGREALPRGAILHRRLWRPLTDEIAAIRSEVSREAVDFVICDSLGPAAGPEPEGGDAAIRAMMALRSLERASRLVIAHVSKASADQPRARPFGSVYVQNLARSTIEARRQDDGDQSAESVVSLYHRKVNDGRYAKPTAMTFAFGDDGRVTITAASPDMVGSGLASRVLDALKLGSQTVTAIANDLELNEGVVRTTLNRLENRNKVTRLVTVTGGKGKKTEWGLLDANRNTDPC